MKVLKAFKTVNQVFKVGDEFYDDIENLEHWVARDFVGVEEFVNGVAVPVAPVVVAPVVEPAAPVTPVPPAATEVPTATFA
jgi:hypothetical protein